MAKLVRIICECPVTAGLHRALKFGLGRLKLQNTTHPGHGAVLLSDQQFLPAGPTMTVSEAICRTFETQAAICESGISYSTRTRSTPTCSSELRFRRETSGKALDVVPERRNWTNKLVPRRVLQHAATNHAVQEQFRVMVFRKTLGSGAGLRSFLNVRQHVCADLSAANSLESFRD